MCYIGSYVYSIEKENDRLYQIAVDQEIAITELRKANHELQYISTLIIEKYGIMDQSDSLQSPIHNGSRNKYIEPI